MTLEILSQAIKSKSAISFEYNKEGKIFGTRFGNPHAVFIMRKKDGSESTKVDIVQTGGVSDSGQEIPGWRMFDLSEMSKIQINQPEIHFEAHHDYNPESDRYKYVISKV